VLDASDLRATFQWFAEASAYRANFARTGELDP
jgi:hypothetical protein